MQEISLHWLNSLRKQLKVCIQMPVYDLQLSELIHTNHWEKTHSFIQQIFMLWILYARFCIKVHSDKQEQHYLCSPVTSKIKICVYIYIYVYGILNIYSRIYVYVFMFLLYFEYIYFFCIWIYIFQNMAQKEFPPNSYTTVAENISKSLMHKNKPLFLQR